jgi:hypothetical protein
MAKKIKRFSKKAFVLLVIFLVLISQVSFLFFTAAQQDEEANYPKEPVRDELRYQETVTEYKEPETIKRSFYQEPKIEYTEPEPIKEPYQEPATEYFEPVYSEPIEPIKEFIEPFDGLMPAYREPESNFTEPYQPPADFVRPDDINLIPEEFIPHFGELNEPDEKEDFFDHHLEEKSPLLPESEFIPKQFPVPLPPTEFFEEKPEGHFNYPPIEEKIEFIREKIETEQYLPPACQEAGATSPEKCNKLMEEKFKRGIENIEFFKPHEGEQEDRFFNFGPPPDESMLFVPPSVEFFSATELKDDSNLLPPPCRENKIHDKNDCFKFIKYKEGLPQKCRQQGITDPKECAVLMGQSNLPPDCIAAGFTDFEECKQSMGRQFLPPECIEEGAGTEEECKKMMMIRQMPLECREQGITDPDECHKMFFNRNMPFECIEAGVTTQDECKKIMEIQRMPPECQDAGLTDMRDCKILMMKEMMPPPCVEKGIASPQQCEDYMMQLHMPPECKKAGLANMDDCEKMLMKKYMPRECQEAGVITEEACEKIMIGKLMPKKCKEAGATNREECERIIIAEQDKLDEIDFNKKFPAPCSEAGINDVAECKKFLAKDHLPPPCQKAGIYQWKECRDFMDREFMPPECQEAGVSSDEECDKIMRTKHMPPECVEAQATTPEECDKVMEQKYLPRECKDNGLTTRRECDEYFMLKHMPPECQVAGATTPQECDQLMRQLHLAPECKAAGITEIQECEEYMFDKYQPPEFECEGLTKAECKEEIKEKHLGLLVEGRKEKVKIKEKVLKHVGKKFKFGKDKLTKIEGPLEQEEMKDLEKIEADLIEVLPLDTSKGLGINILPSEEKSLLKEETETLVQTVPAIIIIDSDQDGLPDDMEKIIGSDPDNNDTDGDGLSDGEEVKNDFNPLGEGELIRNVTPIETAILNGEILEQPLVDGELKENLMQVNEVMTDEAGKNDLEISGTAVPNSVVTLYMYSTIAILANVQADAQGRWTYKFDERLKDGEHDIYATITNEKGEIEVKSNPKSFFIKEARAQEIKDFIEEKTAEAGTSVQNKTTQSRKTLADQIRSYGFVGVAIIIIFLIILWIILHRLKNRMEPRR